MSQPMHFTFTASSFNDFVAHDGHGRISAARVLERESSNQAANTWGFVDLVVVPSNHGIGEHTHGDDEELYVVVAGRAEMTVDGVSIAVSAGDVIVNRPGGTHGLVNTGDEPLQLVVVALPPNTAQSVAD